MKPQFLAARDPMDTGSPYPLWKLGGFGKAGPVFFTATVGWAKGLWGTLGRTQLPCVLWLSPLPPCQ